mmetsp:Transcript_13462/g.40075  ORF Transcript_13462/g.40075 Transcript_13462/m.40075 type:complete len:304 (+) Transcript_13462:265-1176(+)
MSALLTKKAADYLVHDSYTVETEDHEDHTFNGIMFDVEALATRPVDAIVVDAVYVRGGLGKMTVWCSPGGFEGKKERPDQWRRHLSKACPPSWREFARLELDEPIVLKPGRATGIYVHAAEFNDDGVVYDNQRSDVCHEDAYVRVLPGVAHLSPAPFSGEGPWWGSPWRNRRSFVGKIDYGCRFILWRPQVTRAFSKPFRGGCAAAFFALTMGWGGLPTDCVLYILHLARYDWFDTPRDALAAEAARAGDSSDEEVEMEVELSPEARAAKAAAALAAQKAAYTTDYSRFDNILDSDDSSYVSD